MLTSEQSIVVYKQGCAFPDRLRQKEHSHYLKYAERMLLVYRHGIGRPRRELHRQIETILIDEPNCPLRRIRAFSKLLDDKSTFQKDTEGRSARLRLEIFSEAAGFHPLVKQRDRLFENDENKIKKQIADRLTTPWDEIEQNLYADVMSFQRLKEFEGYSDAAALLSRYNIAQLQACLYRALSITITATEDFKTILRYAKLARLLHEIERVGKNQYVIYLTGPSSILRETRRYGINFARFLPALLACSGWRMTATVQTPWSGRAKLVLSDKDGFMSHLPRPEEFDSKLEENFARKFGTHRDGWQLVREGGILYEHQKVFVPDFLFRHDDGLEVLLEIVGFWTPEYLAYKRQVLKQFRRHKILIAVPQRSLREGANIRDNILVYKTALKIKEVIQALEKIREENTNVKD